MRNYRMRTVSSFIKYEPINLINITSYLNYSANPNYETNNKDYITLYVNSISNEEKQFWHKCSKYGIHRMQDADYDLWLNSMNDINYNSYKYFISIGRLPTILTEAYLTINISELVILPVLKKINQKYKIKKIKSLFRICS